MFRLESWSYVYNRAGRFVRPPEETHEILVGDVFDHPEFPDGSKVSTACLKAKHGNLVHLFGGSVLYLGEPSAEYGEQFPNARARVLNALPLLEAANE